MRISHALLTLFIGTLSSPSIFAELTDAKVTLPYSEVRDLLAKVRADKTRDKKPAPPVSAILSRAEYTLTPLADGHALGRVILTIHSLTDAWQNLSVLDPQLTIMKVDPADMVIVQEEDWFSILLNKEGSQTVTIDFLIPGSSSDLFQFKAAPATSANLILTGDQASAISLAGLFEDPENPGRFHLAGGGGLITANLRETKKAPAEEETSMWSATTESLVKVEEESLLVRSRIQLLTRDERPGRLAEIYLPRLARLASVTSTGLGSHRLTSVPDSAQQLIKLRWESGGVSSRQVELLYRLPRPLGRGSWTLDLPTVASGLEVKGSVVVIPPDDLELSLPADQVLDQQLPAWIKSHVGGATTLVADLRDQPRLALKATPKKRLQAALLTISESKFETEIVSSGESLTNCTLIITYEDGAAWNFSLPKNATLLGCHLDEVSTSPILRADGGLQLPLRNADGKSEVKLSYTLKTRPFDPVEGSTSFLLLQTDAFSHSQSWAIKLPTDYEATAVEGNVAFHPTPPDRKRLYLRKNLSQGETPTAQIYYRKTSLNR